ncbi:MAG: hypothetical protein Q4G13_06280 [Moraxella sp.]|nr:hypothetical protein [Moraxella sp.]
MRLTIQRRQYQPSTQKYSCPNYRNNSPSPKADRQSNIHAYTRDNVRIAANHIKDIK